MVLYFFDCASRYKFLLITNLRHFLFIYFISLHVANITVFIIRSRIGMPVRGSLLTGIPSSHLHRLIAPDDVLIQSDLLMMSSKHVDRWNK